MRAYKLKKCKRVHGLHFAPNGRRVLAVGGAEVRMVDTAVWLDLAGGETAGRIDLLATCYAVDPGLTRYVLGGADQWHGNRDKRTAPVQWAALPGGGEWQTFQSRSGKAPPTFRNVAGLAFDASGERLAIGHSRGAKCTVVAVRAGVPERIADIVTKEESAGVIAFNADGSRLAATGGMDASPAVAVYDLTGGERVFVFAPRATVTRCVQFLPDGRLIVANGKTVYVLPAEGGEPRFTLTGHPKQVNAVTLTPDGQRLLTASHDGMLRVWDADTGKAGAAFDWGIGAVTAVAFAPDGLTCAAAGEKGQVVVWDVDG
jgi:WD40 repeat protein